MKIKKSNMYFSAPTISYVCMPRPCITFYSMRLKLFFGQETNSFHWIEGPDLNFATYIPEETVEMGAFTKPNNKFASNDDEMQM